MPSLHLDEGAGARGSDASAVYGIHKILGRLLTKAADRALLGASSIAGQHRTIVHAHNDGPCAIIDDGDDTLTAKALCFSLRSSHHFAW